MNASDALPLSRERMDKIPSGAVIFDAVYSKKNTPFLNHAAELGLRPIGGLNMLLYQGVRAFELWTGVKPDENIMRKVLMGN
ncbi:MAG TPA: shikimate dehydrogenase, partial [Candidatus Sumerlaeia bacterium]|nr:shikimate dehydrogenase [Candidatus Sumerlaeia bacterium]